MGLYAVPTVSKTVGPPPISVVTTPSVAQPIHGGDHSVKGMDVSSWQGAVDFVNCKANGFLFVFIKATQSTAMKDAWFDAHWAGAKSAGVLRGAYHYFEPSIEGAAQAQWFVRAIGVHQPGDLPCVMDWETPSKGPAAADLSNALAFLRQVELLHGKPPIIYTSPSFLDALALAVGMENADFIALANYPLWIAHWGVRAPRVPAPWRYWTFWQKADHGLGQLGDEDAFNGSMEQLLKFTV